MPIIAPGALPWSSATPRINLGTGEVVVVDRPTIIWTVLGSCVAVILRVPSLSISAVCHALLPEPPPGTGPSCIDACPRPCSREQPKDQSRYVTCCVRSMLDQLARRGALKIGITASIIGGANVVSLITAKGSVGERNVFIARAILEKEGIPIVFADTGGTKGRNIEHDSGTNQTLIRYHDTRI